MKQYNKKKRMNPLKNIKKEEFKGIKSVNLQIILEKGNSNNLSMSNMKRDTKSIVRISSIKM